MCDSAVNIVILAHVQSGHVRHVPFAVAVRCIVTELVGGRVISTSPDVFVSFYRGSTALRDPNICSGMNIVNDFDNQI